MDYNSIKLREFQNVLREKNIALALFLNTSYSKKDPSIAYFSGVDVEFCALAIPSKGHATLFVPGFEYERTKMKTTIRCVQPMKDLWKTVKQEYHRAKVIGINADVLSVNEVKALKKEFSTFKDIADEVYESRSTKTSEEVRRIRESIRITERLFIEVFKKLSRKSSEFHSEKDIAHYLLKRTIEEDCTPAFPPIIASGKNASLPHHEPSNNLLKGFLVIDYGVKKKGYCADLTRTVYLGTPSKKERKVYETVLHAQQRAIDTVKEGTTLKDVDAVARKELGTLSKLFIHSIGHSLGIEVHDDLPKRKKRMKTVLKEGMVITIEPGVYIKNKYGIRIEDDVLVTKKGCENLVKIEKELIVFTT